jgi:hypothetical protein
MISPSITNTELALASGHAMIEVAEIHKQNDIRIDEDGASTRLLKTGLYDFNLRKNQLRVFDGKAKVDEGSRSITVKGGRAFNLVADSLPKAFRFNKKSYEEGALYRWSSLRSAYLAEANVDAADMYAANAFGGGFRGSGANWYWDPWYDAYTYVPGDGIFYSPFGWGFYSPWLVDQAPFYPFYGYGYGFGGRPWHHHFTSNYREWGMRSPYVARANYTHGIYHGPGSTGRGFHSGATMAGGRGAFGGGFRGAEVFTAVAKPTVDLGRTNCKMRSGARSWHAGG